MNLNQKLKVRITLITGVIAFSLLSGKLHSQTTLIDPAGAGGFESGSFAGSGWTVAQSGTVNLWYVGTFTKSAGTYGAYIGTSSSNNNYSKGNILSSNARTHHFYRDVTFPAGESDITFSFKWRCAGDNLFGNDDVQVFLAPTSVTPTAGTAISASYLIGGPYVNQGSAYQTVTMKLSAANAGTTKRLIFTWRNNNDFIGTDPAGAFDQISLKTCTPLPAPTTTSGSICDLGVVGISATPGTGGTTCNWWDAASGGNLLLASATNVNVTINASGSYTYYVSSENPSTGCASTTRTAITAAARPKINVIPSATQTSGCPPYNTTVSGGVSRSGRNIQNVSIPDYNILTSTPGSVTTSLAVSGFSTSLNNTSVRINEVKVNISHTYVGDLIIKLIAPDATQLILANQVGGSGDNFTNTVFKTGGTPIASGSAPFTGNFAPSNPFSNLNGKNPNGTWSLNVTDNSFGDAGNLINWEISFVDDNGLTYSWTSTPSGFTSSASGFTASISSAITYNLSVNNLSQGCSGSGNIAMAASPAPLPSASSGGDICDGNDILLSGDNLASGQTSGNSYQWSGPNGFSSNSQNPVINNAGTNRSGTYVVTVTNQFNCTATASTSLQVHPNPVLAVGSQGYDNCDGTVTIVASNGTAPYDYTDDFVNFNQDGVFTGIPAPGSITVYASDANGCLANPQTVNFNQRTFTVHASSGPNGSIDPSGSSVVNCDGSITYTISPIDCNYEIQDVLVNGQSVGAVSSYTFNNILDDQNISATFVMKAQPQAPVSAASDAFANEICAGGTVQLSAVGGSLGAMNGSYVWYSGSCSGTAIGSGSNISVSPAANTTYYVRVEDQCGNITSCVPVGISVKTAAPTASVVVPSIGGLPAYACPGTVSTISVPSVANASRYIWDGPPGTYFNGNPLNVSPFTTTSPSVQITFGTPATSMYSVGVQAGNSCGNSIRKIQKVRYSVSVPSAIIGSTTACINSIQMYTTPAVTDATQYLWTITGDATVTGTGTNVTVNFGPAWTGGTLCVAAQTPCYTSPTKCITIGTSAAAPGAITGNITACPNSVLPYSIPVSSGAASYSWTVPANASITSGAGTNSIQVSYGPSYNNTGQICVTVTSVCGVVSAPKCKSVSPGIPTVPASITGATNGLCNQNINYSTPFTAGTTYNWTAPGTITGNGNSAVGVQFGTLNTGQVCVTASNGCGTSTARCVTVKGAPNSPAALSALPSSWCANTQGVEFTADVSNVGGSYLLNWTYPAAPVATYVLGGGNSNQLVLDWGTGNGTVIVSASNACGTGSKTLPVTISCKEGEWINNTLLNVYPNPTAGIVNVEYPSAKGTTQVTVLDLSGRVVMTQTQAALEGLNILQLDLSKVAKGAYLLNVQTHNGNRQVRVVVE